MDQDLYLDEMEVALGSKIKDRRAFMTAFRGLINCCEGGEDSGEDKDEDEGQRKGLPSIAMILGGKGKSK